ncbi:MAG: family 10 glycosylhydrolase [Planctomycetota bacterium]
MTRPQCWRLAAPLVCALAALLAGCQARMREPIRAIWVTRSDYRTPADVIRIMDDCADAGFNTVVFQVRGNGTAFYCSQHEPWADELGGRDPGWDPLALACDEAHARKIELHAWVNVMPAWTGPRPPANPDQLYNKRPEWFWYDAAGHRQPLVHKVGDAERAWYVSLNPCLPEVRAYLVDVCRDLVSHYEVDGLHLDYIRFPNEPVVRGEEVPDYPHDARTLELYRAATGLEPDHNPQRWKDWRTAQVTRLVRDLGDMLRWTRPHVVLSASVGPVPENAIKHFQDGRGWRDGLLLGAVFVMNYTDTPESFAERLDPWLTAQPWNIFTNQPLVPVVPGLWFGRAARSPEESAAAVKRQIEIARARTGNFCVFSYASLFDGAERGETAGTPDRRREARRVRREALVPFLRELAQ